MNFQHPKITASVAIGAAILFLYSFSLGHNFLFDEVNIILLNPLIHDKAFLPKLLSSGFFQKNAGLDPAWDQYYRPLTSLTFALNYWTTGANPMAFNIVNTLLHVFVSLLFFQLLCRIFRNHVVAFLCALLYAVHTIHTEAVTYIASRGDLLGAAFLLSCILLYDRGFLKTTFFLFVLSLFCKESCLLLPVYLFLWEVAFLKNSRQTLSKKLWPFVLGSVVYYLYRKFWCPVPLGPAALNVHHIYMRFLSMGPPFLNYLTALVRPEPFKFCEEIDFIHKLWEPTTALTLFIFVLILILWMLTLKYRGSAFFGLTFFLISLAPSFQIFMHLVPEWAEHYLYIPLMGLLIVLAGFLESLFRNKNKAPAMIFLAGYTPFLFFIGYRTYERNLYYNDTDKYYTALAQSSSPYAYYGYTNLALTQAMNDSWDKAYVFLKTSWLINPESECNNYNLGAYYLNQKNYATALKYFNAAYETDQGVHQPIDKLRAGLCLTHLGRYEEAIAIFEDSQKKMPEMAIVYKNLIRANELSGKPDRALQWGEKGLVAVDRRSVDHAALLMELAFLAFFEDHEDVMKQRLEQILIAHPGRHLYSDTVRLLKGEMGEEEYQAIAIISYRLRERDTRYFILLADILNHRWEKLSSFLGKNKDQIVKQSGDPLFTKKILDKAEQILKSRSGSPEVNRH